MAHHFKSQKELLAKALNDAEWGANFVDDICDRFLVEKIKAFPSWCEETRQANKSMRRFYYKYGNKGKYLTNSANENNYGFSREGNFFHKWIVPKELQFFMVNCIYRDFWHDDNARVRDSFMKAIIKGEKDPMQLLGEVRAYYGKNPNESEIRGNIHDPDFLKSVRSGDMRKGSHALQESEDS